MIASEHFILKLVNILFEKVSLYTQSIIGYNENATY